MKTKDWLVHIKFPTMELASRESPAFGAAGDNHALTGKSKQKQVK
jgi:hypothetical protein